MPTGTTVARKNDRLEAYIFLECIVQLLKEIIKVLVRDSVSGPVMHWLGTPDSIQAE